MSTSHNASSVKPLDQRTMKKALAAAAKRIRILSDRKLEQNLANWGLTPAEAYQQGIEEAQQEIVQRLQELAK